MAYIKEIETFNGTVYELCDAAARATIEELKSLLSGAAHYLDVTTTPLSDGATTNPIVINGVEVTAKAGDVAVYSNMEYIWSEVAGKWREFGSTGSLKALAFKDSATGKFTPSGSVSQPTFSGTETSISVKGIPSGTISKGTGTANYTPSGSVSTPTITVTPSTQTKYVAASATGGGSVTAGKAASCTLPSLGMTVANNRLTFTWNSGSFTANTPTAVTLPSFSSQTIVTGISSATSTTPSFTGDGAELKFTGNELTSTGKTTPTGSVTKPSFTGNEGTVSVS